jgi:hypothetical protein
MYVNAKMIPVETTPGKRGQKGIKENGRGGECMYDILTHCKNLCKCHNVLPPGTTIEEILYYSILYYRLLGERNGEIMVEGKSLD